MEKRKSPAPAPRKSRRRRTILIIAAAVAVVIGLIVWEQVALLYVLSTLSVVALLTVVAFANLGPARRPVTEPPPFDDSAAVADGLTAQNTAARPAASRAARGGRRT